MNQQMWRLHEAVNVEITWSRKCGDHMKQQV